MRLSVFLAIGLLGTGVGTAGSQAPAPPAPTAPAGRPQATQPAMREHRGLEYARVAGKPLRLDLFLPARAAGKLPVVVWIHGGAWMAGGRHPCRALPAVARGYAAVSIDYRLSHEAAFPAQLHDCKGAIRWLRAHADNYGLDPQRIGVFGASAGGHLAALLGATAGRKDLEGDVGGNLDHSSGVQAVCDWFGPKELLTMQEQSALKTPLSHNAPGSPESRLIGGPLQENKDKARAASPMSYVSKDHAPILIMHGDCDPLVPVQQSRAYAAALEKAGAPVTLHIVPGGAHGIGFQTPAIAAQVADFFDQHLKSPAAVAATQPRR